MAERPAIDGAFIGEPPAPEPLPVRPVFCQGCASNLSALPAVARFCNRCGRALPEGFSAMQEPADDPETTPEPMADPFPRPLILLAYARALFNLGVRYETAVGSRRNLEEAVRCYWKAARLGDVAARDRCSAYAVAALPADLLPAAPPPLPYASAEFRDPSPPFATVHDRVPEHV